MANRLLGRHEAATWIHSDRPLPASKPILTVAAVEVSLRHVLVPVPRMSIGMSTPLLSLVVGTANNKAAGIGSMYLWQRCRRSLGGGAEGGGLYGI